MLPVVPKRKYEKRVKELEEAKKEAKVYKDLVNRYEKLMGENVRDGNKLKTELEEAKKSLEIEQNTNKRLCEIVQIYEAKEDSKRQKEISRLEKIVNRTKSPYTKQKIENRILKDIEKDIKRCLYEYR